MILFAGMSINHQEIAFSIITYYPKWYKGKLKNISQIDKIRGDLALEFIQKAKANGFELVVVDGKSSKSFRKELLNSQGIKILKRKSIKSSPSKRQAFKAASKLPGIKIIIATEPEKISLIDNIQKIIQPILENKADIVIPKREPNLFKQTYPDYMYESEIKGNRLYNEQLKLLGILPQRSDDLDMFFGPRVFINKPNIIRIFTKNYLALIRNSISSSEYSNLDEYSNIIYTPIIFAFRKAIRIRGVDIPFSYPKIQKLNESIGAKKFFVKKRRNQKITVLNELRYLLNYLQTNRRVR